jgi:hypothetical protein
MANGEIITLANRKEYRDELFMALDNEWHDVLTGIETALRLLETAKNGQDVDVAEMVTWALCQAQRSAALLDTAWNGSAVAPAPVAAR